MKKSVRFLPLTLVICVVVFCLWYTRPMPITKRCPAIDFERCSSVHGYYYLYDGSNGAGNDVHFELTKEDADFFELLTSAENREFRRSLRSLLPSGGRSHRLEDGDYKWSVIFSFDDLAFPDGSFGRGDVLHIDNFFGELSLYYNGDKICCRTEEQSMWIDNIMKLIQTKEA